jgi:hypothetical protein
MLLHMGVLEAPQKTRRSPSEDHEIYTRWRRKTATSVYYLVLKLTHILVKLVLIAEPTEQIDISV